MNKMDAETRPIVNKMGTETKPTVNKMGTETKLTVGIPRALLFYQYRTLWTVFFHELGVAVRISPPTDRQILEDGSVVTIDEACLSLKIYMGHVRRLIGRCDVIFIPRVCNYGLHQEFCTRFQGLYDLVRNVFRDENQRFVTASIDLMAKQDEARAFVELGEQLGFTAKQSALAYRKAKKATQRNHEADLRRQEEAFRTDGMKILLAGHPYMICDDYVGKTVLDFLHKSDCTVIRADIVDPARALKASLKISSTNKWLLSREILGGIALYQDQVDGIILLSAFPCGPDSMTNELVMHRISGIPILSLVMDAQTGTAGVETRLESFIDIIRFKEGTL